MVFRFWTEDEFAASRAQWQGLLAQSDADPLFNSWTWQWHWWKHNGPVLDARLVLVAGYAADGALVAIAPFFIREARHRLFKVRRLELLGRAWRSGRAVFSEYLDLIVRRGYEHAALDGLADALWELPEWGDLAISNVKTRSLAVRLAERLQSRGATYLRRLDPLKAHQVVLPARFEDYLEHLSAGTRRRLWNQRKKLHNPVLEVVEPARIDVFLDVVDRFHRKRWGKAQYMGHIRDFHRDVAVQLAGDGGLRMSTLSTDQGVLSALYNLRVGSTEYNLQSGFDVSHSAGLSPGYLHFGYAIEQACADGLGTFDLLAGEGQHRQYKADLMTVSFDIATCQLVRGSLLRRLYMLHDAFRRG